MEDFIIKQEDLRIKMAELINSYDLPACMVEPIIKDYHQQVTDLKQQQYIQALQNKENKNKDKEG